MKLKISAVISIFTFLAFCTNAQAGAWLQEPKSSYVAVTASLFSNDRFFDVDGTKQDQSRFTKYETNIYAEHGLTNWLTVGTNLFINRAQQGGLENNGIADPEFFIRLPLINYEGWVISAQPLIKLPSAYENGGTLRAGSRSLDFEFSLLMGSNMKLLDERDYIDIRVGYRERSRGLEAQFRGDIVYGIHVTESLCILPAARVTIAEDIPTGGVFRQDGEQDFDLMRAELGFSYQMNNRQRLIANVFAHIQGANTGAGEGITIGSAWQF